MAGRIHGRRPSPRPKTGKTHELTRQRRPSLRRHSIFHGCVLARQGVLPRLCVVSIPSITPRDRRGHHGDHVMYFWLRLLSCRLLILTLGKHGSHRRP